MPEPDDIYWFLVTVRPATLTFGIPAAGYEPSSDNAPSLELRTRLERELREQIQSGLHLQSQGSRSAAVQAAYLCRSSEAAAESPNTRGFLLDLSHAPEPWWVDEAGGELSDFPITAPWYAHYRAVPGRAEVDEAIALVRSWSALPVQRP
jgi:hypothetical protein